MTTAIICDDEPRLAQALAAQLQSQWPELRIIGIGANGGEALALIADHEPDVAFLDIRMPGLSGIEVARQVADSDGAPRIVFVTAYDEYAIKAFDARAVDYLLKPVKTERLHETIKRLQASLTTSASPAALDSKLLDAIKALSANATSERKYLRWLNCGQGTDIDVIATAEVLFFQSRDKYTQ